MSEKSTIQINIASENNLQGISLEIPHHCLTVVSGVSGSGKSSLAFDVIAREGQRRFFETFSTFSRQLMGKLKRPEVESIEGLSPVITLGQKTSGSNPRSTVGTLSDLYDYLRLLFARLGQAEESTLLNRSLFSFNSPKGACPVCSGLGLEEKISLEKLVAHPEKTLREGALAPTLPNGYIMYSQVTVDVLNQVCEAHGFSVDIPWRDLSAAQQEVVLYGSTRLKVPFGKHSLESRLKWTGIAAKPREEGYYKGMIPIMSDILRRDRNKNILRYAESLNCSGCGGSRLNEAARSVRLAGKSIVELSRLEVSELKDWLGAQNWSDSEAPVARPVIEKMVRRIGMMEELGIGYLSLDRASNGLSGGESQRIRLINQVAAELSQVLYVFDEPSIGLHPRDNRQMIRILRQLVDQGNTVIVVEHDQETILAAEWIVDIGPGAGLEGGELLFSGTLRKFWEGKGNWTKGPTWQGLRGNGSSAEDALGKFVVGEKLREDALGKFPLVKRSGEESTALEFRDCKVNNLKGIDVPFRLAALNVLTGVAGAGKSSLLKGVIEARIQKRLAAENESGKSGYEQKPGNEQKSGIELIDKLITIDQKPIGRTPRSNPATYTGLADKIRDLFSQQSAAKEAGFTKNRFSFNTKGGRCETCQGAGRLQMGMHLLGNLEIECTTCKGKRFNPETLSIGYLGKNIYEVFELRVEEAIPFFEGQKKILRYLQALDAVGLGYLTLGQPSTTLSGGEAQRVKLASELQQIDTGRTLYLMDEPTIGLHIQDVKVLIRALRRLIGKGNTVICIEHDPGFIRQADWVVDLGPESGERGGEMLHAGPAEGLLEIKRSLTGRYLVAGHQMSGNWPPDHSNLNTSSSEIAESHKASPPTSIKLSGVSTHLLKNIDVELPRDQLTVITGLSGSGKSSLAFDTLFAEAQSRFSESLSTYTRSLLRQSNPAKIESAYGLGPVVAIGRRYIGVSTRSTVGTLTGLNDHFRLLYSRISQNRGTAFSANDFSFNHISGACPTCKGLGFELHCAPDLLLPFSENTLLDGAFVKNRVGKFYGDPYGRHFAILKVVAQDLGIDLEQPWGNLPKDARDIILYGTGDRQWKVTWEFKNKTRSGTQELTAPWPGFCNYVDEEYQRKLHNKNIGALEELLEEVLCTSCQGSRLKPEQLEVRIAGLNIAELGQLSFEEIRKFLNGLGTRESGQSDKPDSGEQRGSSGQLKSSEQPEPGAGRDFKPEIFSLILPKIYRLLDVLEELGLPYLSPSRASRTLSGGEGQRIRLARAFSAMLYGVTYVLDEPTIGLHAKDVQPLIRVLRQLIHAGNTVIVVEHDETVIREADYLIEMGPGAGRKGGNVTAVGIPNVVIHNPASLTGKYLLAPPNLKPNAVPFEEAAFGLRNARIHNLKGLTLEWVAGGIIALTGVSGSGKSTLMQQVLLPSAQRGHPVHCESTYGLHRFDQVIVVDQKPIVQHTSSTVATWSGAMAPLRDGFASTPEAKAAGLKKSAFSHLHKSGACPECKGSGRQRTALDFLGEVDTVCESCDGQRYQAEVLAVKYHGWSIAEVLALTVEEANQHLKALGKMTPYVKALAEVGLGHLQLGQSLATLSGGEAQRLKLSKELIHHRQQKNLYLLDEPTTGLHFQDVEQLIRLFQRMVANGHTIMVIEHHPMLQQVAHQVIELGPGGGEAGGELVSNRITI